MPLPFILGAAAIIAGTVGVGKGIGGAVKMKEANDTAKSAQRRHENNMERFNKTRDDTDRVMDEVGKLELDILNSFEAFSDTIEKIQGRPKFKEYSKEGVDLPEYNKEKLKEVSVGAGVLLGGLGGAAVGTAGGFAAAGATTTAVMALGTASTGTAIASLSGAAATNATLAALGGGAIAAGGGGIALGTAVLGAATAGVGLLVGGLIFSATGSKLSDQADEACSQMKKAEKQIDESCKYLNDLREAAGKYKSSLTMVYDKYKEIFAIVSDTVNVNNKIYWKNFTQAEKTATQNSVMLVALLYKMCQVKLVKTSEEKGKENTVNHEEINGAIVDSYKVMAKVS